MTVWRLVRAQIHARLLFLRDNRFFRPFGGQKDQRPGVNLFGYTRVYKVTLPFLMERSLWGAQKKFLQDSMHWVALPESLVMASLLRNQMRV
jgi:hypothetical protein